MCWMKFLEIEQNKEYFKKIESFLAEEISEGKTIYPEKTNRYKALDLTPIENIKVVILGQDPYHGEGQAHGLSFSVPDGVKIPPSLRNIYKELQTDIKGFEIPNSGNLTRWAKQGVLLLNAVLTVESKKAGSHSKIGWETFTDNLICELNEKGEGIIFLLWGSYAQKKGSLIDQNKHRILQAPHPSPLSSYRGFFGCAHFSKTNEILVKQNKTPIAW